MGKRFFLGVFVILVVFTLTSWGISIIANFNIRQINGIVFSGTLATLNIVLAFTVIQSTINKDAKSFNKIFLTSILFRFFLVLLIIFIIIKYSQVDLFIFLTSLFILYFVYQIWEVIILNSNLNKGK